jgi:hypothetical protein
MSIQQLRTPAMAGHVAAAARAVAAAGRVPAGSLERGELGGLRSDLAALEAQVTALKLAVLAEADHRRVADDEAATGTDAWAARLTGSTRAVMRGGIWLARALADRYDATREAFAAGSINEAQVRVIVDAAERLPKAVTPAQRADCEAAIVAKAVDGMNARVLRQAARRMVERVSRELADAHEATLLADEARRAETETYLWLNDNGDGTWSGRFTVPELHGHLLNAYLQRLTSPRRLGRNRAGELVTDPTLHSGASGLGYAETLGLGLLELVEHLPHDGHGPVAATLLVHVDHARLVDQLASARLDTGTHVSVGEARRLACGAGLLPAVLGSRSEVLDLGRVRRLHTPAQRRALSVRHETCAAEGCDRPFAWCEVHHPHAWSEGGGTDLDNALPLCGFHHRRAHDRAFDLSRLPSGEVRFRCRR